MNYGILALLLGIVLTSIGAFSKKTSIRKPFLAIGLILLIPTGIYLASPTTLPFLGFLGTEISLGGTTYTAGIQPPGPKVDTSFCVQTDPVTVTLSAIDSYLGTASGGTHAYKVDGGAILTVSNSGTFTASPKQKLEVLWMNGSATSSFSKIGTYEIPCRATYTPSDVDGTAVKVSQNGSLTISIFNDPNQDATSTSATGNVNQTLSSGQIKNLKVIIQGDYQKDFPYGIIAVIESNKTTTDDTILQDRSSGIELTKAEKPQTFSSTYGTDSATRSYLISSITSNAENSFTLVIDTDDTNNPLVTSSDIKFTFFARNNYINDKKGGVFEGPNAEDEYNAVTRTGQISRTLYVD